MKNIIPPKPDKIAPGVWWKAYHDRVSFEVPKGVKRLIEAYADEHGESLAQFIEQAVMARMGVAEWPEPPQMHL